jgi:formamidopyrimidine-DNA glycosylase
VFHLMIAGRFHWKPHGAKVAGKVALAAFDFPVGTLLMTEASSKKRASLHLVKEKSSLAQFDRGGLEVLDASLEEFHAALLKENHTLKRVLTDPRLFSGTGNAYSDEILHRARLSPLQQSQNLSPDKISRLYRATREVLTEWIDRRARRAEQRGSASSMLRTNATIVPAVRRTEKSWLTDLFHDS